MNELYDQIVASRGKLKNWMDKIPGFRGYQNAEDRREADRMIRDYVARELGVRIDRMAELEKQLVMGGGMMHMTASANAKQKLTTFQAKVKTATPGYSGFMAAINIGEEEMDILYAFDEAQARYLDEFDGALTAFEAAINTGEGIPEAIREIARLADEATQAYSMRDDVLKNIDQKLS